ncbi:MAG: lipoprotein [Psychrobacter sp.]|nr:lipoprotein [Psychrobacter sp.]
MLSVNHSFLSARCALMAIPLAIVAITGCGQKNDLYLVDPATQTVTTSSDDLASTNNPQDAAFADLDDSDYEQERYLEQQQIFPEVSNDPNDY